MEVTQETFLNLLPQIETDEKLPESSKNYFRNTVSDRGYEGWRIYKFAKALADAIEGQLTFKLATEYNGHHLFYIEKSGVKYNVAISWGNEATFTIEPETPHELRNHFRIKDKISESITTSGDIKRTANRLKKMVENDAPIIEAANASIIKKNQDEVRREKLSNEMSILAKNYYLFPVSTPYDRYKVTHKGIELTIEELTVDECRKLQAFVKDLRKEGQ